MNVLSANGSNWYSLQYIRWAMEFSEWEKEDVAYIQGFSISTVGVGQEWISRAACVNKIVSIIYTNNMDSLDFRTSSRRKKLFSRVGLHLNNEDVKIFSCCISNHLSVSKLCKNKNERNNILQTHV